MYKFLIIWTIALIIAGVAVGIISYPTRKIKTTWKLLLSGLFCYLASLISMLVGGFGFLLAPLMSIFAFIGGVIESSGIITLTPIFREYFSKRNEQYRKEKEYSDKKK